jgi:hypothetical protein
MMKTNLCFFIAPRSIIPLMIALELIKAFLQVPELLTVGSAQERAAFIATCLEGRTVREAAQAIGVSKSQVTNLADLFKVKLATRMMELRKKRVAVSAEYRTLSRDLYERLCEVRNASGNDDDDWWGGHKIGSFDTRAVSREDWAEATGTRLRDPDE